MNKKFFEIYIYPLVTIILSLIVWYIIAKFVLKIDLDSLLYQFLECKAETCVRNFKIFFYSMLMVIYFGWVFYNIWIEHSKSIEEKERKVEFFFVNYGRVIVGIVVGQFLILILAIALMS